MGAASQWQIEREAQRLIRRAVALFPGRPLVDALVAEASSGGTIKGSTIRRWRPSYREALSQIGGEGGLERYDQVHKALEDRRGTPDPAYGATLGKKTVVTKAEAIAVFRYLKRMVLRGGSRSAMAAGLYVLVVSRIAIRPIELLTAEVVGNELRVRNAKWREGMPLHRSISLRQFSPTFVEAVRWLCVLARAGTDDSSGDSVEMRFERWRNRVASSLARASMSAIGKRLSLYVFRHLGIATWKSAGFSALDIAAMAGHLGLGTAAKHYAPASSGWADEAVLAEPGAAVASNKADVGREDLQPGGRRGSRADQETDSAPGADAAPVDPLPQAQDQATERANADPLSLPPVPGAKPVIIDVDDMPQPSPQRREPKDPPPDIAAWAAAQDRKAQELAEIAQRLPPGPRDEDVEGPSLSFDPQEDGD